MYIDNLYSIIFFLKYKYLVNRLSIFTSVNKMSSVKTLKKICPKRSINSGIVNNDTFTYLITLYITNA